MRAIFQKCGRYGQFKESRMVCTSHTGHVIMLHLLTGCCAAAENFQEAEILTLSD